MRGLDDGTGLLRGLHAVDRLLHLHVEVLYAEADAVETEFAEQAHGRPVGLARVDLDAVVARIVVQQVEVGAQLRHEFAQLAGTEEGRGSATEVQLLDHLLAGEVAADDLDLADQARKVRRAAPAILGDHLVAGAVVADVGAERDVHVERQGVSGLPAVAQGVQLVERADAFVELHGGRIGGVTRAGKVVAPNQVSVPANGVEHARDPQLASFSREV